MNETKEGVAGNRGALSLWRDGIAFERRPVPGGEVGGGGVGRLEEGQQRGFGVGGGGDRVVGQDEFAELRVELRGAGSTVASRKPAGSG